MPMPCSIMEIASSITAMDPEPIKELPLDDTIFLQENTAFKGKDGR